MDFELDHEQRMWQRVVRDFCEAELKPYAAEVDQTGQLHWEWIRKMKDVGLLSLAVPEEYDGIEADLLLRCWRLKKSGAPADQPPCRWQHTAASAARRSRAGGQQAKGKMVPRVDRWRASGVAGADRAERRVGLARRADQRPSRRQ